MRKRRPPTSSVPAGLKCPRCSGIHLSRTRGKWWHRLWSLFGLHIYRCKDCGNRFSAE
ncbi:MAG TPA: hypothetical protein VG433_05830 [Pirellulales bacterium]|nr:hypothetical protein [Pirellulales bacterium]